MSQSLKDSASLEVVETIPFLPHPNWKPVEYSSISDTEGNSLPSAYYTYNTTATQYISQQHSR